MDPKSILLSKTLWLNVAMLAAHFLPVVADVVPPDYQALVLAVANIAVRFATKQPVKL